MPPRKLHKVGLRRIDAAIDALGQLGFSRTEVSDCVNRLLKVYGGDDGWSFIEECSYQLVIESILEHRNEQNQLATVDGKCKGSDMGKDLYCEPITKVQGGQNLHIIAHTGFGSSSSSCLKLRRPCYGWVSDEDE